MKKYNFNKHKFFSCYTLITTILFLLPIISCTSLNNMPVDVYVGGEATYAENKKYDKLGLIKGKKVHFRRTPYGTTMKDLRDGELVYVIKNEKIINRKNKEDTWYQAVTTNEKIGWVRSEDIYYLDGSLIPEKYYTQILNDRFRLGDLEGDEIYDIKFEYLKEYNIIIFRYLELIEYSGEYASIIYEIKDDKAIKRSHYLCSYGSKFFVDEKFIINIEDQDIEIYNRKQFNKSSDGDTYIVQAEVDNPYGYSIDINNCSIDFNKSENCYYIKIIAYRHSSSKNHKKNSWEEIYKFDGEKIVKIK